MDHAFRSAVGRALARTRLGLLRQITGGRRGIAAAAFVGLAIVVATGAFAADPSLTTVPSTRLQPAPAPLDQQLVALQQQLQALQAQLQTQQQQIQAQQQQQIAALSSVVSIASDGTATIRAPNVRIETIADLSLRSSQHVRIESGADLSLRSGTDLAAQSGAATSIRAGSSASIDSSGQLALHSAAVQINNGSQPAMVQINNGGRPVATAGSAVVNNVVQSGSTSVLVN
jgi:hypothetical protein